MPVDQAQLQTDLEALQASPRWQNGDAEQRRQFARDVAAEAAPALDPDQHQALTSKLWEQVDPRGWVAKSADFVGSSIKELVASAAATGPAQVFAVSDAVGLTNTGSGTRLKRGVADLGNAAIQTVKQFAPGDEQQKLGETLDALRTDIHNNAVPEGVKTWLAGGEVNPQDAETQQWIGHLTDGLGTMAARADTRLQFNPGLRTDAVTTRSEAELKDAWLKSDRNPANTGIQADGTQMGTRDFLADYLVTRDPQSWQQFVNRVTETESQYKTRVARSLTGEGSAQATAQQMGPLGNLASRGMDMQTSPIDLATAVLPVLRGTKLLAATQAAREGNLLAQVGRGAATEALQEGVTQKLQDARASNASVLEAAAMGALGSGALEGSMAGVGTLIRSPQTAAGPTPETPASEATSAGAAVPPGPAPRTPGSPGSPPNDTAPGSTPPSPEASAPAYGSNPAASPGSVANEVSSPQDSTAVNGAAIQWQPESVRRLHGERAAAQTLPAPVETQPQAPYQGVDVPGVGTAYQGAPAAMPGRPPRVPDSPLGGQDILDFVNQNPIAMPRKGTARGGDMDWAERFNLPKYYRRFIAHESGRGIDQVAEQAFNEGLIPDPSADALMGAVESAIQTRKQYRFEQRTNKVRLLDEEKRVLRFEAAQAARQGKAEAVPFDAMQIGDELTVAGEAMQVKHLSYDEDGYPQTITMEDGRKFGLLSFDANRQNGVLVDEYRPVPRAAVNTDFLPPEATAAPAFDLTSATPEQLRAEQALQQQRATLRQRAQAPLQGTAGDMGTPDLLDNTAGQTPLFDQRQSPADLFRTTAGPSAFDRATLGDESAWADMEAEFRARYGYRDAASTVGELSRSGPVYTQAGFAQVFEDAWQRQDYDAFLEAMKLSDRAVWAPLLKDFFRSQADNPVNAQKAEWFRAAMAGTRPPGVAAAPSPVSAPPPPRAPQSATPPPPPPAATVPPRIPVKPLTGRLAKSPYQIIEDFSKNLGKHLWVRRLKPRQLGVYRPGSTVTAVKFAGDLDTAAHELAGHWMDDKHGLGKDWAKAATSPYDAELATFWVHGSPSDKMIVKRAEGIAEFFRAYVMDPQSAMAQAPKFAAYVERTIPNNMMQALNAFSDDVRTWAGENPLRRTSLNIRMDPPSRKERLRAALFGDGRDFSKSFVDKMVSWFSDEFHYAVKGFETALKMQGKSIKNLKPSQNFELLMRWFSGHDSRFSDQLENGLTTLNPTQVTNADGQLEVQRVTDPVTGQPMNLAWLLEAFDNTSEAAQKQDMREASALMVAERTLEKARLIDEETAAQLADLPANASARARAAIVAAADAAKRKLSGLGAGMMSDVQAANEALTALNADPAKARRLREAARRYRAWANANLDLLVQSGRMTQEAVDTIRAENAYYVDMHRLSDEFDLTAELTGQGGTLHPGNVKSLMKRYKGSTLEIDNVYASLLKQTESLQKEAARNRVMQSFVQQLESARGLYDGEAVELDRIGSRATSEDRNTVRVYRNGKEEFWKLDADITKALKGVGDLGTHPLIDLVSKPQQLARYLITRSPGFVARNVFRDTVHRSVVSDSGAKLWDLLNGYTAADKARLMAYGGGMFGHYGKDRYAWNKELDRGMAELRKDPRNLLMTPVELWKSWDRLAESSEAVGRIAEFRRAYDKAVKQLGYSPDEAALYAANEARGLMDFAKTGSVMRQINKIIPFSNAAVRGLSRTASGLANDPLGFSLRWTLYVALPTLAVRMLARQMGGDTEDEYQQLPAWQRDFFWNIKVGNYWVRLPKPHELGVLAGGVERALSRELGEKNSFDGYGGSVSKALLPVGDIPSALGPLKAPAEIIFNRDSFRDRNIVPVWESDLRLDLRKGATQASLTGQAISKLMGVDPRYIDHYLSSYGGLGQALVDFTRPERKLGESAVKATGVILPPISSQAKDYQWVVDWAKANGELGDRHIKALRDLSMQVYKAATPQEADTLAKLVRQQATALRQQIEAAK